MLYHKNKGNPLEKWKKICDVIIFAMLETISDCCWGRLLLESFFFFKQNQMRDDGGLDLADISPNFLTFELGSELTRCGGDAEKNITGVQRKGGVLFLQDFLSLIKAPSCLPPRIHESLLTRPWLTVTIPASTPALLSPPAFLLPLRTFY